MGKKKKQLVQEGIALTVEGADEFVQQIDRAAAAIDRLSAAITHLDKVTPFSLGTVLGTSEAAFDARVADALRSTMRR